MSHWKQDEKISFLLILPQTLCERKVEVSEGEPSLHQLQSAFLYKILTSVPHSSFHFHQARLQPAVDGWAYCSPPDLLPHTFPQ